MQPAKLLARLAWQTLATALAMAAALLGASGDPAWPQAWAFLAIFVVSSAAFGVWLTRRDPGLLAARLSGLMQPDQPLWDRIFLLVAALCWFGWLGVMGLEARRHGVAPGAAYNLLGAVLIVTGFTGVCRVFAENSFAAPQVRLQQRQRVITTGPYALVRHPMYSAGLLYIIGIPLLLGSRYGLACTPLFVLGVALRARKEEEFLARDLAGYDAYRRQVRWRLMPGIW